MLAADDVRDGTISISISMGEIGTKRGSLFAVKSINMWPGTGLEEVKLRSKKYMYEVITSILVCRDADENYTCNLFTCRH